MRLRRRMSIKKIPKIRNHNICVVFGSQIPIISTLVLINVLPSKTERRLGNAVISMCDRWGTEPCFLPMRPLVFADCDWQVDDLMMLLVEVSRHEQQLVTTEWMKHVSWIMMCCHNMSTSNSAPHVFDMVLTVLSIGSSVDVCTQHKMRPDTVLRERESDDSDIICELSEDAPNINPFNHQSQPVKTHKPRETAETLAPSNIQGSKYHEASIQQAYMLWTIYKHKFFTFRALLSIS